MRLANDEITIALSPSRVFVLRASLRAAFRLYKQYGSYSALSAAIASGSLSACCDLIKHACENPDELSRFCATADQLSLREAVLDTREQLLEFVLILAGGKQSGDEPSEPTKPITFDEYHAKLFRIATGWFGWSPAVAWDATPAEIINAQQGRIELLGMIFGKSEQTETIDTGDAKARAQLNALGDLGVMRLSEVR